ncbi:hypothetical protein JH06_3289 [Blastocystis sp. subtype 4]|uniref:hypothetical protein n=1 Tax=Blastocystis sp. subtype 4 TaxID=944170 RepID=UPI00071223E7|nr:hypothetical protein JH06_3289 [Blastocystis sp. subtype 4]KNB42915.1 hypothetical protein JH06_3289 [Blastocystis sp. subtype 4]|eukprot:XP_014526358.1 hypothetical protein JH06_3289 [Blastocystis sp. subtype 4]
MVCSRCEKKMGKLVVPDKWKDGARNANPGGPQRTIDRSKKSSGSDPIGKSCRICKVAIDPFYNYCTTCAYKKGICARCGRKVQDTKFMKLSNK